MKILILCTGNSCRSQMAQGFLKSFGSRLEVCSAGTFPSDKINPLAVSVMGEAGIDISGNVPQNVNIYLNEEWDYVITVCDDANETCPIFPGKVSNRLHIAFEDPSRAIGTEDFILSEFRRIRDDIKATFFKLYSDFLK
jgi:arsenate reductase